MVKLNKMQIKKNQNNLEYSVQEVCEATIYSDKQIHLVCNVCCILPNILHS